MRGACRAWLADSSIDALEPLHRFRSSSGGGAGPAADAPANATTNTNTGRPSQAELARLIVDWIAAEAQLDPAKVSTKQALTDFALDSFAAVCLLEHLEQRLGTSVSGAILQESRDIDELSHRLVGGP
jgi:acyl carrier protein